MTEPLIRVNNLKKYFKTPAGDLRAVDDVSFDIYKGKTLGIVGESGCGKSTLGRVMIRLLEATEGKVFFEGKNIFELSNKELRNLKKQMQIIFQDPYSSLNPRLTVSELIAEPLIVNKVCKNKKELEARIFNAMEKVGLNLRLINTYPHELDGGRRQRIGVARALVLEPKFIVCDEPVSALDVSIQAQILNLLMDLQDEMGLTYVFITHDLSVVKHISDEILVMYMGKCVEKATTRELFNNPLHPYTKALFSAIPVPDISNKGKRKEIIRGEVVSPVNPPPGCRFANRCKYCTGKCTQKDLDLIEVSDNHFVACILHEK